MVHIPMTGSAHSLESIAPAFFALHIAGGHVGVPILVVTFLVSKKAHRHPTIVNFCITWIIYSVSYSLLLYDRKEAAPRSLCLLQPAFRYGATSMAAVASLSVVIQIWSTFYSPWDLLCLSKLPNAARLVLMLSPPYIVFLLFWAAASYIAVTHPDTVDAANGIYCTIHIDPFAQFSVPIFCTLMVLVASILEVSIAIRCYRGWRHIKDVCPDADLHRPFLSPYFRASAFLLYTWITFGACISFVSSPDVVSPLPYMAQAALPLMVFIVFGSQEDVFFVWFPCLRRRKAATRTVSIGSRRNVNFSTRTRAMSAYGTENLCGDVTTSMDDSEDRTSSVA